ncbi:hypothetical protein [Streptomyces sp. NPDC050485]|uniref:hypothetical protein n=1 Tax=Streptomyces sp. NPDC050485 TaxID=3365617 RepID=UPI0037A17887
MVNELTKHYLAMRETFGSSLDLPAVARQVPLLRFMADRFLSRPGFTDAAELSGVVADLGVLFNLFTTLPERLYGADAAGFARALDIDPTLADIMTRTAGLTPPVAARADLYHDGTGFRLLELNWSLAGAVSAQMGQALLRQPDFRQFALTHGLVHTDALDVLARRLREAVGAEDGERPLVAVTAWPTLYSRALPSLRLWAHTLERAGFDAHPCSLAELAAHTDGLYLGRQRVEVVYRCFPIDDVLQQPDAVEPLLRAWAAGRVHVFAGFDAEGFGSKRALALVSGGEGDNVLSKDERGALERLVPWTRALRRGRTRADGQEVELIDYAMAHRRGLVLKPSMRYGGAGVHCGWTLTDRQWRVALTDALKEGGFVVQRRVVPVTEPFHTANGVAEFTLNWGVHLTDRGYAGLTLRGLPGTDVGTVNAVTGAGAAPVFHPPL